MDGPAGEQNAERRALLSLAMAVQPNADEIRSVWAERFGFRALEPGEALQTLAAHRTHQTTILPMIFKPLSKLAVHRKDLLPDLAPHLRTLHVAVAKEVKVPDHQIDEVADRLHEQLLTLSTRAKTIPVAKFPGIDIVRGPGDDDDIRPEFNPKDLSVLPHKDRLKVDLDVKGPLLKPEVVTPVIGQDLPQHDQVQVRSTSLAMTGGPPTPPSEAPPPPGPIDEYLKTTAAHLGVDPETLSSPPCDDRTKVQGSQNGYIVEIEWWTTTPVHKFRSWLKPSNWPKCNRRTFFKDMQKISYTAGANSSWSGEYLETVVIEDADSPLKTGLSFAHEEERANGTSGPVTAMWTTYDLTNVHDPATELLLDNGVLAVQRDPDGQTHVWLTKTYEFKDPAYKLWPTLACDTFFGELSMLMASNCGKGFT